MLAESLRHHLGDLTDEDTEVRVNVGGFIFAVTGFGVRDGVFVLYADTEPVAKAEGDHRG